MKEPWKKWVKPKRLDKHKNGQLPPEILAPIKTGRIGWRGELYRPAAYAYNKMWEAAKRDGIVLKATGNGYRGIEGQVAMFKARYSLKPTGRKPPVTRVWQGQVWHLKRRASPSATPGRSIHGWGCAVDLQVPKKTYEWLCACAPCFGFYLQGPRELPNGKPNPEFEPWHWEWSGD